MYFKFSLIKRETVVFLLILTLIVMGCATKTKVHPKPSNIQSVVREGDTVKIVSRDKRKIELKVLEITSESIIGKSDSVDFDEMESLEILIESSGENIVDELLVKCKKLHVYPPIHPGDYFLHDENYEADNKKRKKKCYRPNTCGETRGSVSCNRKHKENILDCENSCIREKGYEFAKHIDGGFYDDGSYYSATRCGMSNSALNSIIYEHSYNLFTNIHPLKDRYSKTKWQTYRDECLELTSDNFTIKHFPVNADFIQAKQYFRNCLKVRGYLT